MGVYCIEQHEFGKLPKAPCLQTKMNPSKTLNAQLPWRWHGADVPV